MAAQRMYRVETLQRAKVAAEGLRQAYPRRHIFIRKVGQGYNVMLGEDRRSSTYWNIAGNGR